jgi:3-hydroxyisobutyrate dehydrogenase
LNIVIIGCGEVGYLYASALANLGCSLSLCAPRPSERVIQLVSENQNTTLYKNLGAWLKNAEIVISCTPGMVALDVASEAITFLKKGAVYADFSTSSPEQKQQAALLAESKEIYFADCYHGRRQFNRDEYPIIMCWGKNGKNRRIDRKIRRPHSGIICR